MMSPQTIWITNAFYLATALYLLGLTALLYRGRRLVYALMGLGLAANLVSLGLRLYGSWPMQVPYQEPFWLPACLACLVLGLTMAGREILGRGLIPVTAGLALFTALFPMDYYLPFPRSLTIFSHLFLLFSAWGMACFWAGGVEALLFLLGWDDAAGVRGRRPLFGKFLVWGFVLYTLSLFTAEIWSYLGWASPVVWDDYTMTSTMGTWFFYGCFLHLYLLKQWPLRKRAWFAAIGPALLFYFNYLPQTGLFRLPVIG